jgi:hypothetical protein
LNRVGIYFVELISLEFSAAVKKNPFTSSATHTDVMDRLKVWLRKSSDRNGGRAERGAKKLAAAAAVDLQRPGPSGI